MRLFSLIAVSSCALIIAPFAAPADSNSNVAVSNNKVFVEQDGIQDGIVASDGNTLFIDQRNALYSRVAGIGVITPEDSVPLIDNNGELRINLRGSLLNESNRGMQLGSGNDATIRDNGSQSIILFAQQTPAGMDKGNDADLFVNSGVDSATIFLQQYGSGNDGTVKIFGNSSDGILRQIGDENTGFLRINGDDVTAELIQVGTDIDSGRVIVTGNGGNVSYTIKGNGITASDATITTNAAGTILISQESLNR
jgi:hypothetical protein